MYPWPTRATRGGVVGDSSMESGADWRSKLQSGLRQSVVDDITDYLKKHGNEGLKEIKKNAVKVEEKMYSDATSEFDYIGKIYLTMEEMEKLSQNHVTDVAMQLDFVALPANTVNPSDPASLDSTPQNGNPNGEDWQEEVYQKIKAMKDLYLQDLNDMHQQILDRLQKLEPLPRQPDNGLLEKLGAFKSYVEWFMQFLQIPKHGILADYKEKLASYEFQIVNFVNFGKRKLAPQQQQAQNPPPHLHSGSSLPQNARSGPQQVNINPMPLQQNGVRGIFSL